MPVSTIHTHCPEHQAPPSCGCTGTWLSAHLHNPGNHLAILKNCFPVVCIWISSLNWLIPCLYEPRKAREETETTRRGQDQICIGLNCYRIALYPAERPYKKSGKTPQFLKIPVYNRDALQK